jgi:ABC-type uncharacterized transport system involved in gliding motility auxiliary subunit
VLVNWFVERNNHRWDLTPTKRYSLSEQSEKIARDLTRDVTIYVFDRQRAFREHRDLLEKYTVANPRVKLEFVDPDRQPDAARRFNVRSYGTVVVAAGERHLEAQGLTEEAVTNALIRVLKEQRSVCFIQGHGERDLENSERAGYSQLRQALESENYKTQTLVLLQNLTIPAECSQVIIAGPRNDYLEPEIEALRTYVQGGGRLLAALDPGMDVPNLVKFLGQWNVKVRNDLVVDENPLAQLFGTSPTMPLVIKYGASPIVRPLERTATLFPVTRSFEVAETPKPGVSVEKLCETSAESYSFADFSPRVGEVTFRPDKDQRGPLTVAVAGTLRRESNEGSENSPDGRFVALGTSALAANNYLGFQANRDFFLNVINWLSADEDLISIRPKPPESQQLNLNSQQMRRLMILGVFGVPALIVAGGISVWWRRR